MIEEEKLLRSPMNIASILMPGLLIKAPIMIHWQLSFTSNEMIDFLMNTEQCIHSAKCSAYATLRVCFTPSLPYFT